MTRVFVYESITGGGLLIGGETPGGSFLREGLAMVTALAADFAAVDGVEVAILQDQRLPSIRLDGVRVIEVGDPDQEQAAFARHAAASDWTVVIAPEIDGALLQRCRRVGAVGGRLLGPSCDLVKLASNKQATVDSLQRRGIPVPVGIALAAGEVLPGGFPYPAVLKPWEGAGSRDVRLYESSDDAPQRTSWPARLERFCPGMPASVSILGGPTRRVLLPACRQRMRGDGQLTYVGGALPMPPHLAQRARRLAERTIDTLPEFVGYLGIDLILGPDADGREDAVIEINPRLTTSYVGLRASAKNNLAGAMLQLASGDSPALSFHMDAIEFDAAGVVQTQQGVLRE